MQATHLSPAEAGRLVEAPLTYRVATDTAAGVPAGYASFSRTAELGPVDFADTAEALMSWQVQLRSGVRVAASSPVARVGSAVMLGLGVGPLALRAPCRVVRVVDEPALRGFAYGTLPGHPESGEESFILELHGDGRITLTIAAFSRPASRLARAAGPVSRAVQHGITRRYLRAHG